MVDKAVYVFGKIGYAVNSAGVNDRANTKYPQPNIILV